MLTIRRAVTLELDNIMEVIHDAQKYLAYQNINQWQDNFPSSEIIKNDVENAEAYVIAENGEIGAYFSFFAPPEPAYENIYDGRWQLDTQNYAAMHRIAISSRFRGKGLAHLIYDKCESLAREYRYDSLRVDTHKDNKIMQHLAKSHGFVYCGVIYYGEANPRIAFEKSLL